MQRSFTQQMQDLAGQLHSEKEKLIPIKNSRQALGVSTIDIVGTSLANPLPAPPLSYWGLELFQKGAAHKKTGNKRQIQRVN